MHFQVRIPDELHNNRNYTSVVFFTSCFLDFLPGRAAHMRAIFYLWQVASVLSLADAHKANPKTAETEKHYHFPTECDASTYGARSPDTSLPPTVDINEIVPSLEEFEHAHKEGVLECNAFLDKEKRKGSSNQSKARKMLLDNYGVLLWTFGPR